VIDATSIYGGYATLLSSLLLIPTFLFGVYWFANKDQPAIRLIAIGSLTLLAGFVLAALRGVLPSFLGIFGFNILVILGLTLRLAGIRVMVATDQANVSKTPDIVISLLGCTLFSLAYALEADFLSRVALVSSWVAVIYFVTVKVIWDFPTKGFPHWLLLFCILGGALVETWRGLTYSALAAGFEAETTAIDLVYFYYNPSAVIGINLALFILAFIQLAAKQAQLRSAHRQRNAELQRVLDERHRSKLNLVAELRDAGQKAQRYISEAHETELPPATSRLINAIGDELNTIDSLLKSEGEDTPIEDLRARPVLVPVEAQEVAAMLASRWGINCQFDSVAPKALVRLDESLFNLAMGHILDLIDRQGITTEPAQVKIIGRSGWGALTLSVLNGGPAVSKEAIKALSAPTYELPESASAFTRSLYWAIRALSGFGSQLAASEEEQSTLTILLPTTN